jgi:hypothetical protein
MARQRLRLMLTMMGAFALALSGYGQTECISVTTRVSADEIESLLRSGDTRLVAWGAYFAGESSDDGVVTTMLQLIERGIQPRREPYTGKYFTCPGVTDPQTAMSVILDALIKRNEKVPPEALATIEASFPNQAVILSARLSSEKAWPLLERWYESGKVEDHSPLSREVWQRGMFARVASMLMAKDPPSGFAADVLAESKQGLVVSVPNGTSSALKAKRKPGDPKFHCEDELRYPPPDGAPPLVLYAIEENKPQKDADYEEDHLLVEGGGDRITFRRAPAGMVLGSCYSLSPPSDETRYRLVAEMLGVKEAQMPWKLREEITLRWESKEKFLLELGNEVSLAEAKLHATIDELYTRGFLTRSEADSTRPKLLVEVHDDRRLPNGQWDLHEPPLPELAFRDARTLYGISP